MKKGTRIHQLIMPILCLLILFGIAVCSFCGVFPQTVLGGVTAEKAQFPQWSAEAFGEGEYQSELEGWINENFPFRSYLVKCYSQFLYSVMKESSNSNVVMGKDNYLFEKGYIEHMRIDGWDMRYAYKTYASNLKIIQDAMEAQGKTFFYIVSPSKAEILPERVPFYFDVEEADEVTHHDVLVFFLEEYGVNYYDTSHTMQQIKQEGHYLPYTKNGTHWTHYATARAVRDVFEHLYIQTGTRLLEPQITVIDGETHSGEDLDLQKLINVSYAKEDDIYAQVDIRYELPENYVPPKVYLFGTSFQEQIGFIVGQGDVFKDYSSLRYLLLESRYGESGRENIILDGTIQEERLLEILNYYDIFFFETNVVGVSEGHFELVSWLAEYYSGDSQKKIKLDAGEVKSLKLSTTTEAILATEGEKLNIAVNLKNGSSCTLKSDKNSVYPFCFAYRIFDKNEQLIREGEWTVLTEDLKAGAENVCNVNITAPEEAGEFILQITAVQDKVMWMETANPEFPIYLPMTVQ